MKALVIGSGAREHALTARLAEEGWEAACAPGNTGIARHLRCLPLDVADLKAAVALAQEERADLVVVGPEAPLIAGLVDALSAAGILAFGPSAAAARIEGSKAFAKEVMVAAKIPTASHAVFDEAGKAIEHAQRLGGRVVVKADGIAAGKGVVVCNDMADAREAIEAALVRAEFGVAGRRLVIEERLEGREVSLMAVCDGVRFQLLPLSQDYKRVGDGDIGPNTGGMGAVCPPPIAPQLEAAPLAELAIAPALERLRALDAPFRGVLYAGLMLTPAGPKVLEYNCRLGDPETQVLLERVDGELGETMAAAARGDVGSHRLGARPGAAVGVVACADGYPRKPRFGDAIQGLDAAETLRANSLQRRRRQPRETRDERGEGVDRGRGGERFGEGAGEGLSRAGLCVVRGEAFPDRHRRQRRWPAAMRALPLRGWIIHRYVAREIVVPAATSLAFLFQLLIALQLLRRTDVLFGSDVGIGDVARLLLNLTPHYLTLAAPIALLIGVLVGLGRLAEDREVEVLLGCGVPPALFAVAPLLLAFGVGVGVLGLELGPEPAGLQAVRQQIDEVLKRGVQRDLKPGVFYDQVTDLTLFAESIDPKTGEWRHVLVHDERDHQAPLLLLARSGGVLPAVADEDLKLKLADGEAHREGDGDYSKVTFKSAVLNIGVESSLLRRNTFRSPDEELTLADLWAEIRRQRIANGWWQVPAVAFHRRLGLPLAALTFVWLGVPLAIGTSARGSRARGYLFGILAIAGYYVLQHLGIGWGADGKLAPWLAGELANVVALATGAVAWVVVGARR